ncbi:MAG: ATP-grasp domain-containing protein, partial [Atribacterota bacterium]|nr:ATP-grasp domain-containing protein [Atribacterota bacterium]
MKVLVIGNGGREHAIIWKLAKSPQVDKIYCAPGNAGIDSLAECINVEVEDFIGLLKIVHDKKIDLTIVGPEIPLSLGIVNLFQEHGYPIFGPTREAAEIESSKVFAKYLMNKYSIPTAKYKVFDDDKKAIFHSKKQSFPLAIKADGLAAGKGVFIVENFNQAEEAITHIMKERKYGQAGDKIIIEEYLAGEEVSMLVFSDGINIVPMITSQDHKKL